MRPQTIAILALLGLSLSLGPMPPALGADEGREPLRKLEAEMTAIEKDMAGIEKKIDLLLEDLVDPRVTTLSLFFSSGDSRERVPVSVEVILDGRPLSTKGFSETDRMILVRGGALEVYNGILDPSPHKLVVRSHFAPLEAERDPVVGATFTLEPTRAAANFVEIALSKTSGGGPLPYSLSAKTWSREP